MEWTQTLSVMATVISCAVYIHQDVKTQCARTDRLYEMFIDLLKDNNKQS